MIPFTHLHVHTEYSTLDGASKIPALVEKAVSDGMTALAITDHGNMYGVKEFFNYISKKNKGQDPPLIKPIIGCEVYVAVNGRFQKKSKEDASGDHLVLLAKDLTGYRNLILLVSLGYIDGMYYKPRIDKEILAKHSEGLIVSSACLGGEIPRLIRRGDTEKAEEAALWYKNLFGGDFYLELQRHETHDPLAATEVFPQQQVVNEVLLDMGRRLGIKCIATNDVHFVNEEEAEAHDRLLCISTNANVNDPKRMRYTKQEWFKTRAEMAAIFADIPEVLENTAEIADKVSLYDINSKPIMPVFPLPEGFENDSDYLTHLTWEGAKLRYPEVTDEISERIQFELDVIINMGFSGYFLIVRDFITAARKMGVSVGPGRGSASGSVVAYCLTITDVDPIKYDLLFERFLNPDRISMPDIDIDFDDDGRFQVLQYVTEKYGKEKVAHIVTFGTMATKSAIKDVARVQQLPLSEADRLTKLIPDRLTDKEGEPIKINLSSSINAVPELKSALESNDVILADTMKYARMLEGTVRQTGIHACGIIIARDDLMRYVPVGTAFDKESNSDVLVVQYEGSLIEEVGMLKMDFLGLRTLSIIKEALLNIQKTTGQVIDISTIPIDDAKTYELYSRGDTVGTFQFESDGMRKYLRDLQPTQFEDLIAMNALYRPGPMEYIPDFIARKHGLKPIEYDIPVMERYLSSTYGITVYQEQVMLLSRLLGNFTRGQSDELRKVMGKKQKEKLPALWTKFRDGCLANGYDERVIKKIWEDWEKFASYAFNKSHSTCYSLIAYQTAWLKANFPSEYMAALLSRNISDITEITKFMDECRRMGMQVLGPDINESDLKFTVNRKGDIRFGLGAIKGVGENAVAAIVAERIKGGPFTDIFDFVERVPQGSCNKKTLESLALAGAFDAMECLTREQFFATNAKEEPFIDSLIRYGSKFQADQGGGGLFGELVPIEIAKPEIPRCEEWPRLYKLNREKELIGIYLSSHPLDIYKYEVEKFCNSSLTELKDFSALKGRMVTAAGIVSTVKEDVSKNGKPWGKMVLEDYTDTHEFAFFGKDYEKFQAYLKPGSSLLVRAQVQPHPFRKEELELKVQSISLLGNVRDELLKSIELSLPIWAVSQKRISELEALFLANPGKVSVRFLVIDPDTKYSVTLFSRNIRVEVTNALMEAIQRFPYLECTWI